MQDDNHSAGSSNLIETVGGVSLTATQHRFEQLQFSNRFYSLPYDFYCFQFPTPLT